MVFLYNGKSLVYSKTSMDPKTEPLRIPYISVDRKDVWIPTLTHCCLLLRKDLIFITQYDILYRASILRSKL